MTHHSIEQTAILRERYRAVRTALPWFDAAAHPEDPPAFPDVPMADTLPHARAEIARPGLALSKLQADGIHLLRYHAAHADLDRLGDVFRAMAETGMPLAVLHTEVDFDRIESLAADHARLPVIIESGDRKLLYHIERIEAALKRHANLYVCTYNFGNWLGHENMIAAGLGDRLLFGTHAPRYAADVAMAPIIMGDFDWRWKCALAGNNLRRLIGQPEQLPPEVAWAPPAPFIVDAHTHNQQTGSRAVSGFPTPDMTLAPEGWVRFMDRYACQAMILIPSEALFDGRDARVLSDTLRERYPGRFYYMAIFNPHHSGPDHLARLERHLRDPHCVAIKIHPTSHKVDADHPSYDPAYRLACVYRKPIMTHSWEISDYNPEQYRSHPDRFRAHLQRYPETRFVLGHAGGRPSAFDATVHVCRDFPHVQIDFSGDYYHAGVLEAFAHAIGPERMLFASDVDWFDPRGNLGLFLGSGLDDAALACMLIDNARRVYGLETKTPGASSDTSALGTQGNAP